MSLLRQWRESYPVDGADKKKRTTGLSQQQLADMIGVSKWTVLRWEKSHYPEIENIYMIEKVTGKKIQDLFPGIFGEPTIGEPTEGNQ